LQDLEVELLDLAVEGADLLFQRRQAAALGKLVTALFPARSEQGGQFDARKLKPPRSGAAAGPASLAMAAAPDRSSAASVPLRIFLRCMSLSPLQ
jgi:hypothetical protein